ncbi:inactive protein RESTRICTED TEV MOVEMENT 1 [Beta vulgaris subsp. vulgaris]|uniref:inactive protein RESTRICTED TEV MOVEMENT 1 n=1 Tax=Beta vulgaris subsp. vulgaris TaxID=3555 RepID=UPI0020368347|nr:inactive protein RESTRICTED TEV MOVEMENT 1 [Beta vulgaris subsp. vulgaris]
MLKVGPFPSPNHKPSQEAKESNKIVVWDEKGKTKLTQMFISYDEDYINSLAFQYIEDGKLTLSPVFGSQHLDSPTFDTVTFMGGSDKEYSYITKISGVWGKRGPTMKLGLTTLTIETDKATYGPFGCAKQPQFQDGLFSISLGLEDQFGGFHGTSSSHIITSIGVYVKPVQDLGAILNKTNISVD